MAYQGRFPDDYSHRKSYPHRQNNRYNNHNNNKNKVLPGEYKIDNYSDNMDSKLFGKGVQLLVNDYLQKTKITSSQVRRFYDKICSLNPQSQDLNIDLNIILAQIAYSVGRKNVCEEFFLLMENRISNIKTPKDFSSFKKHFECIVAYLKYINK